MTTKRQTFHRCKGKSVFFVLVLLFGEQAFTCHVRALAPWYPRPQSHRRRHDGRRLRLPQPSPPHTRTLSEIGASRNDDTELAAGLFNDAEFETELRREFDAIGGGADSIDTDDLQKRLAFVPMSVLESLFGLADTNDDGRIDFEEYVVARKGASSPRQRLSDALNQVSRSRASYIPRIFAEAARNPPSEQRGVPASPLQPIAEVLNITAILLCSFLVAVSTLESLPRIPVPTDQLQYFARDVLSLTLTRDGGSIEAIMLINAVLVTFNKIFAADFFTVSVPPNMDFSARNPPRLNALIHRLER